MPNSSSSAAHLQSDAVQSIPCVKGEAFSLSIKREIVRKNAYEVGKNNSNDIIQIK